MSTLGNFIWFIFCGGLWSAIAWYICGAFMFCTVIGIPFSAACFRIAKFAAFPFGKHLVDARMMGEKRIPGTALANFLWIIFAGLGLALTHVLCAITCLFSCILIVPIFLGAPAWAKAHLNLASVSFAPLGKRVVSTMEYQAILNSKYA